MIDLRLALIVFATIRPRQVRSIREWALEEMVIPDGKHAGKPFTLSVNTWNGPLLDAMSDPQWRQIWIMCGVQMGKTYIGVVLPTLYHLFEVGERVIFGVPSIDMAQGIWEDRLKPIIEATRYRDMIPLSGAGSKGGKFTAITFRNGATLRFMGAGGGDQQRSSHTSRVVVMTEVDRYADIKHGSEETTPADQIIARTTSYGEFAKIYAECTVTTEEGRIWQEVMERGSGSKIHFPCPGCGGLVYPEREYLMGWNDATDAMEARDECFLQCPHCQTAWDEATRFKALQTPYLLHKGQTMVDGELQGETPNTYTLGFVCNQYHSGLVKQADIAEKEWEAANQDSGKEAAERALNQFTWVRPHKDAALGTTERLTRTTILEHLSKFDLGTTPRAVEWTVGSIDVQQSWLYYMVEGWNMETSSWLVDFGVVDIVPRALQKTVDPTPEMVTEALNNALAHLMTFNPVSVWIDASYKHSASRAQLVKDWATGKTLVNMIAGRGQSQIDKMTGEHLPVTPAVTEFAQPRRQANGSVLWFVNVDKLKDDLYSRFRLPRNSAGYKYLPQQIGEKEHSWYVRHITSEKPEIKWLRGRQVRVWSSSGRTQSRNDLWDLSVYSLCGALVHLYEAGGRPNKPVPVSKPGEGAPIPAPQEKAPAKVEAKRNAPLRSKRQAPLTTSNRGRRRYF